jgi:hypothetical protein
VPADGLFFEDEAPHPVVHPPTMGQPWDQLNLPDTITLEARREPTA